jgi:DNA-binding response OmpR family regulator
MPNCLLVVEDDLTILDLVSRFLTTVEADVIGAGSLEAGHAALADHPRPTVVLVDRTLPDGDGLRFCRDLRARRPDIPVLLMTGQAPPDLDLRLVDGVLEKPFTGDQLRQAVTALVRSVRSEPPRAPSLASSSERT